MPVRDDAISIWNAGIAAVDSAKCVAQRIHVQQQQLWIAETRVPLSSTSRIEVIGAGKAGAGTYQILVRYMPRKDEEQLLETPFQVRLSRGRQEAVFKGTVRPNSLVPVTTFNVGR